MLPNFAPTATDAQIISWAVDALEADRRDGVRYRQPADDAKISLRSIGLMADRRVTRAELGIGTTLNAIDRLTRQQGYPVRSALSDLIRHAPEMAADAARLYALRRAD